MLLNKAPDAVPEDAELVGDFAMFVDVYPEHGSTLSHFLGMCMIVSPFLLAGVAAYFYNDTRVENAPAVSNFFFLYCIFLYFDLTGPTVQARLPFLTA